MFLEMGDPLSIATSVAVMLSLGILVLQSLVTLHGISKSRFLRCENHFETGNLIAIVPGLQSSAERLPLSHERAFHLKLF